MSNQLVQYVAKKVVKHKKKKSNVQRKQAKIPRLSVSRPYLRSLCAQTDPFCTHAIGAKIPDNQSRPTLAFHFRQMERIVPNATGGTYLVMDPTLYGNSFVIVDGTTSVLSFPATATLNRGLGTVPTLFNSFRIVSAGVRFVSAEAADDPPGFMELYEVPSRIDVLDNNLHTRATFQHDALLTVVGKSKPSTYIFDVDSTWISSVDGPVSPKDEKPKVLVAGFFSADTSSNSGAYWVEMIYHCEGVVDFGYGQTSNLDQYAAKPRPDIMAYRESNAYAGHYTGGQDQVENQMFRRAKQYLHQAAYNALPMAGAAFGGYMGGPKGAQYGGMIGSGASYVVGPADFD